MTSEEAIKGLKVLRRDFSGYKPNEEMFDMAIEALKCEAHDGCDGCMYEENEELTAPCTSCKQNYTDRYIPEPKHDIDWIVGCIKHDGFIKTDRGDKANQIILEALNDMKKWRTWSHTYDNACMDGERERENEHLSTQF